MAKSSTGAAWKPEPHKKTTSIGNGAMSRRNTKQQKKRGVKMYRGQGK